MNVTASSVEVPVGLRPHGPDAHWVAGSPDGGEPARASAWWSQTPPLAGRRPGVVGHFSAPNPDTARVVLDAACAELRARGCDIAIGPMHGNTWRSYRFIIARGDAPPFLLEPDHPDAWPDWWRQAGFQVLARYYSTLNPLGAEADPRRGRLEAGMREAGVTVRSLDADHFARDLGMIFDTSLASFAGNFLYTPIERAEFFAMYERIRPRLRPDLVLLAECEGRCAGYLFALPDLPPAGGVGATDTVIVKTLAVRPGRRFAGLGALLLDRFREVARAAGFRSCIHALMHQANPSRNFSTTGHRVLRTYALLARDLR